MRISLFFLVLFLTGAARAADPVILVLGDSLSSAYGLPRESGWVHLLARRLESRRPRLAVVNASVAGETSAGGLTRLPELLAVHHPAVVVLALGANDGLRGLPVDATAANLEAMLRLVRRQGGRALLVGMRLPPNYGEAHTRQFQAIYPALAKRAGVPLAPFLLEGVATRLDLFQADGLHPDAQAQPVLLENVWRTLAPLLPGT